VTAVTTGGFGLEQRQCDYGHNALPQGTLDQKRSADQSRLLAQSRGPLRELAMPVAILLVIPFGLLGAFLGLLVRGFDNNVYTQIALIMLIGLAVKNAILIVEFAKLRRDRGEQIVQAALDGAKLRLRPILMTSFAFILGAVPLAVAFGAGAGARRAIGTAVVSGMLIATLIGMFFIPAFHVLLQALSEKNW